MLILSAAKTCEPGRSRIDAIAKQAAPYCKQNAFRLITASSVQSGQFSTVARFYNTTAPKPTGIFPVPSAVQVFLMLASHDLNGAKRLNVLNGLNLCRLVTL
jgi:hypothetical protein